MRTNPPVSQPTSRNTRPPQPFQDLSLLQPGDTVEIRQWDTVCHRGEVDTVAPALRVLWLLEEPLKSRKLIDAREYSIWQVQPVGRGGTTPL